MRRLVRSLNDLAHDNGFTRFQNAVTEDLYEALRQGYAEGEDAGALGARLIGAADGQSYGPISLHGFTLSGGPSEVDFRFRAQSVSRPLGNMAWIALATAGDRRLFQRLTLLQNLKSDGETWNLDREQLFLLKNFPTFSGHGQDEVTFRNKGGSLGSIGLLASPGEMLFAKARLMSEFARGLGSVTLADISVPRVSVQGTDTSGPVPMFWLNPRLQPQMFSTILEEYFNRFGPELTPFLKSIEFLGNVHYARDLYDLVRSWTRLSIGEPTSIDNIVVNDAVDSFANCLLRSAGLGDLAQFPKDDLFGEHDFTGDMSVLVIHLKTEGND